MGDTSSRSAPASVKLCSGGDPGGDGGGGTGGGFHQGRHRLRLPFPRHSPAEPRRGREDRGAGAPVTDNTEPEPSERSAPCCRISSTSSASTGSAGKPEPNRPVARPDSTSPKPITPYTIRLKVPSALNSNQRPP